MTHHLRVAPKPPPRQTVSLTLTEQEARALATWAFVNGIPSPLGHQAKIALREFLALLEHLREGTS